MRKLIVITAIVVAAGCDRSPQDAEKSAEVTPTAPTVEKEPDVEVVELDPSLPEADVQAVFDTWLRSQNDGDFESYSSAYAAKFEGIKRVGARMYRYGREGWLKDRQRMFKKKMSVKAADVRIQTSASTAVVVFEQTWASGSYKDVGPKQLIIVNRPDGLKIAREEMLASHIAGDDETEPRAYDPQALALLAGGAVILDLAPKPAWEKGPAKILSRPNSATKALDVEASGFSAWLGREMEVFDSDGEACTAKIARLELVAHIIPHFGTVQLWDGEFPAETERASDAKVAAEIWSMASQSATNRGVQLVGHLDRDCDGTWAKPKGAPTRPLAATRLDGPASRDVLSAFTDLPGYHEVQADYASDGGGGAWHESADAQVMVTKFGGLVAAAARAGYGCGAFEGGFWAIWTMGGQGSLILQTGEEQNGAWYFAPTAAAQLGDLVYFTDGERVVSKVRDSWDVLWEVQPLNFDCGC